MLCIKIRTTELGSRIAYRGFLDKFQRLYYTKRLQMMGKLFIMLSLFGAWLRPVERTVRVREVARSNRAAPTRATAALMDSDFHEP